MTNLPGISTDIDSCLKLFKRKYRDFLDIEAEDKASQDRETASTVSDASPDTFTLRNPTVDANPFGVSYLRNAFFTGRESVLEQIHTRLNQETTTVIIQVQAISGLGGIGKTQTAVEYAYRYYYDQKSYDYVFWVKADTESNLITDFAGLANQLTLPVAQGTQGEKKSAVRAWLANNNNWLLVFDNADMPDWLAPLMPNNPKGKVLITSRADSFDQIGIKMPITLDVMSSEESIVFYSNEQTVSEQILNW